MVTIGALLVVLLLTVPLLAPADAFCDNVKSIAATLPKNTSSSPVHFAAATVGQAPDTAYALALCRGDVLNDSTCAECVASTFDMLLNQTLPPPQQCYDSAASYYCEYCIVIYSNDDILAAPPNTTGIGGTAPFESWNIDKNDDRLIAGARVQELLGKTVAEAAASTKPMRFATAVMDMDMGGPFPRMYSLAQCTPDLSWGDCLTCLSNLLGMVTFTKSLRMGGQMSAVRCYFRYETAIFYHGEPMLRIGLGLLATTKHKRGIAKLWAIAVVVLPLAATTFLCLFCYSRQRQRKGTVMRLQGSRHVKNLEGEEHLVWQGKNLDLPVFDFEQIMEATNNFSEENKLGQGGFGAVYKGQLPEGLEIAVKRLASHSRQGFIEFKNEVNLIAKFQHRNLVRLLGCCSQEEEKILVYEYLPNKSLDFFIFDGNKRALLDYSKQVAIIQGVAHGLLYLHKHSQLLVIHRDLKPSNILLDNEMNPKISDFGLAKVFCSDNTEGNTTKRVVGTYGYMAPEYASQGHFSIKSDVFSFGVLVLEILSGKRNFGNHQCGAYINLLGYAWQLFKEGRWVDIIDAPLLPNFHSADMMRCINIALLCVQENAVDRPTMLDVAAMLSSKTMVLSEPKKPAYFSLSGCHEGAPIATQPCSVNNVTISIMTAR